VRRGIGRLATRPLFPLPAANSQADAFVPPELTAAVAPSPADLTEFMHHVSIDVEPATLTCSPPGLADSLT
jgi:hypothetical protein